MLLPAQALGATTPATSGKAYVAARLDLKVGQYSAVRYSPNGSRVYVVSPNQSAVQVIDPATGSVSATFETGTTLTGQDAGHGTTPQPMFNRDGSMLYTLGDSGTAQYLLGLNTATGKVSTRETITRPVFAVSSENGEHIMVISNVGNISNGGSQNLVNGINLFSTSATPHLERTSQITQGQFFQPLAISNDGANAYGFLRQTGDSAQFVRVDTAHGSVSSSYGTLGGNSVLMRISPNAKTMAVVMVGDNNSSALAVIDVESGRTERTVKLAGSAAVGMLAHRQSPRDGCP